MAAAGNTVLCPQSCLNLGSWATLFKLQSNCICEQQKLYQLQQHSLAVATDAGVALGGLILIYFGSCCMHAYLISERVHAGYDYRKVRQRRRAAVVRQTAVVSWAADLALQHLAEDLPGTFDQWGSFQMWMHPYSTTAQPFLSVWVPAARLSACLRVLPHGSPQDAH